MHVSGIDVIILIIIANVKHDLGSDGSHMGKVFITTKLEVAVVVRKVSGS